MLVKKSTLRNVLMFPPIGTLSAMPDVYICKNGGGFNGPLPTPAVLVGGGTFGVYQVFLYQLRVVDTDTLGELSIGLYDGTTSWTSDAPYLVVQDLPGESVTQVNGDIFGDLLGSLMVAERLSIANAVFTKANGIEPGLDFQTAMKMIFAFCAGLSSVGNGVVAFQNFGQTGARMAFTFNDQGERLSVTYVPTP